jgi:hypothetical protein
LCQEKNYIILLLLTDNIFPFFYKYLPSRYFIMECNFSPKLSPLFCQNTDYLSCLFSYVPQFVTQPAAKWVSKACFGIRTRDLRQFGGYTISVGSCRLFSVTSR